MPGWWFWRREAGKRQDLALGSDSKTRTAFLRGGVSGPSRQSTARRWPDRSGMDKGLRRSRSVLGSTSRRWQDGWPGGRVSEVTARKGDRALSHPDRCQSLISVPGVPRPAAPGVRSRQSYVWREILSLNMQPSILQIDRSPACRRSMSIWQPGISQALSFTGKGPAASSNDRTLTPFGGEPAGLRWRGGLGEVA